MGYFKLEKDHLYFVCDGDTCGFWEIGNVPPSKSKVNPEVPIGELCLFPVVSSRSGCESRIDKGVLGTPTAENCVV